MNDPFFVLFSGADGARRTAVARELEGLLLERGTPVEVLDEAELAALADLDRAADQSRLAAVLLFAARPLIRNRVSCLLSLPARQADFCGQCKAELGAGIECFVQPPAEKAVGKSPPPEVIATPEEDPLAAARRVARTLEVLKLIPAWPTADYSAAEDEQVQKRLRDLGYIS